MSTSYPRPDFERPNLNWKSLIGQWDFLFDDEDVGLLQGWHLKGLGSTSLPRSPTKSRPNENLSLEHQKSKIEVPYVFQTAASGINDATEHEVFWYERTVGDLRNDGDIQEGKRLLLRFGAVDYEATVWVDGHYVGLHRGGHVPFDIDISDAIKSSSARLTVRVRDSPQDQRQPRGKQYWRAVPESIFYTPSSGIWQSVWLESVPPIRIADSSHGTVIKFDDIESGIVKFHVGIHGRRANAQYTLDVEVTFAGTKVTTGRGTTSASYDHIDTSIDARISEEQLAELCQSYKPHIGDPSHFRNGAALWTPEHPYLYDVLVRLSLDGQMIDEVKTMVGLRRVTWIGKDSSFQLNGQPYFQALVLDQGYWPSTGITPPSPDALKADIEMSKAMGFNGCRKHQKVEDPIFLYWADRLGYLVWGEMANAYEFDTTYIDRFDQEWRDAIRRDINHPCIVVWTPVNESWGYDDLQTNIQHRNHIRSLYHMTKSIDPTRPVNENCGWEHVITDLLTFHDYADSPVLTETCKDRSRIFDKKSDREIFVPPCDSSDGQNFDIGATYRSTAPILCTEFGGVNIAPGKDETVGERDWGYTTASDPADLLKRLRALVDGVVSGGLICGFVYTQLTDIEQEVNGLYSFDRRPKLEPAKVKEIMDQAKEKYYDLLEQRR